MQNEVAIVKYNETLGQQCLHALQAFKQGDIIIAFFAKEILKNPTYLTVQVNNEEHITLAPELLQYTNHSCNPNVFFNTSTFELEALKNIAVDEELTFFYPSTEWVMDQPFFCNCKNDNCLKQIQGASFLEERVLQQYRLNNFIQLQLKIHGVKKRA
jgi:SET domain